MEPDWFEAVSKEDLLDILAECRNDLAMLGKTIFPERFNLPFSSIHHQIFDALQSGHQLIAIAAPRGFGKTTVNNLLRPASSILYQDKKFIVPISNTNTQAVLQSENLKRELTTNPIVRALFGEFKSDTFSKEMWITSTGTAVFPRGAGQQVRGVSYNAHRPDLIILDDAENPDDVRNEEIRKKTKEWFFADVLNSVDRAKHWQVIVVGTILHEDSLLENLLNDPNWHGVRLEICDDEYRSNWPDFLTDAAVKQLAESYRAQGLLDVFYREYRNIPISTEDAIFRQEYFKYYEEKDVDLAHRPHLETFILVDPAKTVKIHSAESALVAVSIDLKSGTIFVRDVVADKMYPDDLYNNLFIMAGKYKARAVGLEVTSLNEFITYPIKNEMVRRGLMFELIELKPRAKKEDRIAAMVPFYRQGFVYHNPSCSHGLEAQLLSFPRCKRFDIIDALAYFVEMLELGNRYFQTDPEDIEDEYKELDNEMSLGRLGNWRIA